LFFFTGFLLLASRRWQKPDPLKQMIASVQSSQSGARNQMPVASDEKPGAKARKRAKVNKSQRASQLIHH
jgi:hypothetical protein